jgi:hypothetical protein
MRALSLKADTGLENFGVPKVPQMATTEELGLPASNVLGACASRERSFDQQDRARILARYAPDLNKFVSCGKNGKF